MNFKKSRTLTIKASKYMQSHKFNELDINVQYDDEVPLFGISKFGSPLYKWGIIHIPSDTVLAWLWRNKKDVITVFEKLHHEVNLNSIFHCTYNR